MKILKSCINIMVMVLIGLICSGSMLVEDKKAESIELSVWRTLNFPNPKIEFTMTFKTLESPTVGVAYPFFNHIYIDPEFWYNPKNRILRLLLVYHEYGHLLWKGHDDNELKDGCPSSIMNSKISSRSCAKKHWDRYIKEFESWQKETILP